MHLILPGCYGCVEFLGAQVIIILKIDAGGPKVFDASTPMILDDVCVSSCAIWRVVHAGKWLYKLGVCYCLRIDLMSIVVKWVLSMYPMPLRLWLHTSVAHNDIGISSRAIPLIRRKFLMIRPIARNHGTPIHWHLQIK